MCEQKFFRCRHCGNFVGLINNANVPMMCCGEPMTELVANSVEANREKHVPKIEKNGRLVYVEVGSVLHPATAEHHIDFIYLQTEHGGQRKCIPVGEAPKAMFMLLDDKPITVYAYCNLHGLWKADVMCDCGKTTKDCDCTPDCNHNDHDADCGCGK